MIEFKHVTKTYDAFTALDDLQLFIEEGTVFGFVGSNGAGKSTAFSILATLLAPTSGDATVDGHSVVNDATAVRAAIGYMPDFFGVYDQLKTEEYLDFYGSAYGLSTSARQQRIDELLALVRLTDKRGEYVDLLSRGMKQRLCLARALIHDPKVLILDEPASGLDPQARSEMKDIVHSLKAQGKTILISSHILPELAEMCDEIGVLDKGKLISRGSVASIQGQLNGDRTLQLRLLREVEEARAFLLEHPLVSAVYVQDEQTLRIQFKGLKAQQAELLAAMLASGLAVYELAEETQDLEDVYLALMKGAEQA